VPSKATSGMPAYSPALCQIKSAIAKLLISSPGQNPGRSSRGDSMGLRLSYPDSTPAPRHVRHHHWLQP